MKVNYLRVSITDFCDLRCIYCRSFSPEVHLARSELLSFEELELVIRWMANWGIRKVRITGGEPLLRKDIPTLVGMIQKIPGIEEIAMTTNGTKLCLVAPELKQAGLQRVNVSLDSLNRKRFSRITGYDKLHKVLEGIKTAQKVGLNPVKINVVVLKNINDVEIPDFIKFGLKNSLPVRFIEYMPIGEQNKKSLYLSNVIVKRRVEKHFGSLHPLNSTYKGEPAKYYKVGESGAIAGFISPMSCSFCKDCNRLRLTADGKLYPCLLSNSFEDIKRALRGRGGAREVKHLFNLALLKKKNLRTSPGSASQKKPMFQIGG
ncbi:MAG: GTP 3',8-cyclase MoaA [Candidatus Aerophobetes bacterium]|nr:GTP 3',8-cyclase MoaA [Candidatus Aerophobetes bacterium]